MTKILDISELHVRHALQFVLNRRSRLNGSRGGTVVNVRFGAQRKNRCGGLAFLRNFRNDGTAVSKPFMIYFDEEHTGSFHNMRVDFVGEQISFVSWPTGAEAAQELDPAAPAPITAPSSSAPVPPCVINP